MLLANNAKVMTGALRAVFLPQKISVTGHYLRKSTTIKYGQAAMDFAVVTIK